MLRSYWHFTDEVGLKILKKKVKQQSITKKRKFHIEITPRVISVATVALFLIGVIFYIGFQIYKFQTPPQLTISQPLNETRTETSTVLVKGMTDLTADIEINGEPVDTDDTGWFEKEIELNPGVNTINIKARKDSNSLLESSESIKITYQPPTAQEPTVTPPAEQKPAENKIKLQIVNSSAWIKLDIDDVNKLSEILDPSTEKEYVVNKKFTLITGRVQSTKLLFNGEEVPLGSKGGTGVAQVNCQIAEKDIVCK